MIDADGNDHDRTGRFAGRARTASAGSLEPTHGQGVQPMKTHRHRHGIDTALSPAQRRAQVAAGHAAWLEHRISLAGEDAAHLRPQLRAARHLAAGQSIRDGRALPSTADFGEDVWFLAHRDDDGQTVRWEILDAEDTTIWADQFPDPQWEIAIPIGVHDQFRLGAPDWDTTANDVSPAHFLDRVHDDVVACLDHRAAADTTPGSAGHRMKSS